MKTIEQKEIESSRHVRILATVHATNYSNPQDVEAATLALLWCAFEHEAMAQGITQWRGIKLGDEE